MYYYNVKHSYTWRNYRMLIHVVSYYENVLYEIYNETHILKQCHLKQYTSGSINKYMQGEKSREKSQCQLHRQFSFYQRT